jgi:hypothetical protein
VSDNQIKTILLTYGSEVITCKVTDNYQTGHKYNVNEHNVEGISGQTNYFEGKKINRAWKPVTPLIKLQENNLTIAVP